MRVDWCVSSWFRIKNTHSHSRHARPPCATFSARSRASRYGDTAQQRRSTVFYFSHVFLFSQEPMDILEPHAVVGVDSGGGDSSEVSIGCEFM